MVLCRWTLNLWIIWSVSSSGNRIPWINVSGTLLHNTNIFQEVYIVLVLYNPGTCIRGATSTALARFNPLPSVVRLTKKVIWDTIPRVVQFNIIFFSTSWLYMEYFSFRTNLYLLLVCQEITPCLCIIVRCLLSYRCRLIPDTWHKFVQPTLNTGPL